MSRAGALALAALAAVLLGGLAVLATLGPGGSPPPPARPLSVSTSVGPRPALFGDLVTAQAEVVVDGRLADPDSVALVTDFAPYTLVGPPLESRSTSGRVTSLGYRFTLACLTEGCLRNPQTAGIALPPLRVRADLRAGGAVTVHEPWPRVDVGSRVAETELTTDPPPWRLQLGLPRVTYRVGPDALATALTGAAALLVLVALALVGVELARRRRLQVERARRRSAIARAIELTRESATRGPDDRRRALALLARELALHPNGGRRLAPAVERLAWARDEPSPGGLAAIADEVERTVAT